MVACAAAVHDESWTTAISREEHLINHDWACLQAEWGSITLIDALRKLLNAALRDKLNQKMLLLSESGVPLFAPQLIYSQILFEAGSRLDSCGIWVS